MTNRTTADLREITVDRASLLKIVRHLDFGAPCDSREFGHAFDNLRCAFDAEEIATGELKSESQPPALGGIVEETGNIFDLIIGFADNVEELAFRIPAPNEQTPQFVTYANAMRFIARKRRDTLRANLKQEEWQDISTAPKDGTHFLAGQWFVEDGGPEFQCAVTWWSHTWGFAGDLRVDSPTHWKPIDFPTPPQSKKEG